MFAAAGPIAGVVLLVTGVLPGTGRQPPPATPDSLVAELYHAVTFAGGNPPDWDAVRSYFIPEATIVLRTTWTETHVFSVDGFVEDFQNFIDRGHLGDVGFTERVVRMRTWTYGDMAHVLVLYEASVPVSGRSPQRGLDSFLVIRQQGLWRIAALTNEVVRPGDVVPWSPPEAERPEVDCHGDATGERRGLPTRPAAPRILHVP